MKVKAGKGIRDYRTVWMDKGIVCMIDQRMLPRAFRIKKCRNYRETTEAIKDMTIRGAPAIGAAAAYAMAQAALAYRGGDASGLSRHMEDASKIISSARPTAYDLFFAVEQMKNTALSAGSVKDALISAVAASERYADESAEACRRIGEAGERLVKEGSSILTHCNAGALACVDFGTALAPIREAHYKKKDIHVFVDETRPRLQGTKLTAWELCQEDVPFTLIVDNAAGYFMQKGEIDLVIVGADRITKNGDVINKIGTYEKAVLAKENGIPFYVAAPKSTFDACKCSGFDVEIEERAQEEVLCIDAVRLSPRGAKARNPGFDVTPRRYVTGVITEDGSRKKIRRRKE